MLFLSEKWKKLLKSIIDFVSLILCQLLLLFGSIDFKFERKKIINFVCMLLVGTIGWTKVDRDNK